MGALGVTKLFVVGGNGGNEVRVGGGKELLVIGGNELAVLGGNPLLVGAGIELLVVGGNELAVLGGNPLLVVGGGVLEGTDFVGEKASTALKLKNVPPSSNVTQMKTRK
jgi:hypothetical protein